MKNKRTFSKSCLLLYVMLLGIPMMAQNMVKGVVKDDLDEPLVGATVAVKGTTVGAVTDMDGNYSIQVPKGKKTLVFSFIGFKTKEVVYRDQNTLNVKLKPDQFMLNEVVAIGYGVQRKRDITGAVTTISNEDIEKRQAVSVFDALQGITPGVMVINNSAAPGESGSTIRVRGTSTLEGGVDPLYVVDGMPTDDISMINPNDIKSMEILKDAASAAIYGSRSANGVILITTKSGEEGKPKIDIRYLHSWSRRSKKIPQANADDRRAFDSRNNISLEPAVTDPFAYNRTGNYDYQDMLAQTANRNQVDLSLRGGTSKMSYMASLGYLDETGIIVNSWNKRLTGRVNVDFKATNRLKLITRLSYSYQNSNAINEANTIQQALKRPAYFVLYYPDGTFMFNNGGQRNPLAETMYRKNDVQFYIATIYQGIQYEIMPWLKFEANVNGTFKLTRKNNQMSYLLSTATPQIGSASDNTRFDRNLVGEAFFSANKKFGEHSLSGVLGMSVQDTRYETMDYAGDGLISEEIYTTNTYQTLNLTKTGTGAGENALVGVFGRASYNYKGRYLANVTVRRDGSSRFTNHRWGTFPSMSLGWRFSDEAFMGWSKSILKDGKLRLSYGTTGNQRIGNYESINTYQFSGFYYQTEPGVRPNSLFGNPDIKWETTKQLNGGVDLSLFDGRIALTLDYYNKKTTDLLYSSKMPSELGYSTKKINLGSIQNRGIEFDISAYPFRTSSFEWNTKFGFSMNRNKVLSLATGDYVQGGAWRVAVGEPLGQFYGYNNIGVYAYDESNAYTPDMKVRLLPVFRRDGYNNVILTDEGQPELLGYQYPDGTSYEGDIKQMKVGNQVLKGGDMIWEDLDCNGVIDDADRKVMGSGYPDWFASWSNTISYKNFTLDFSFYGSFGAKIFNREDFNKNTYASSNTTPRPYVIYNAWRFPGQQTDMPHAAKSSVNNTNRLLTGSYLEDGSFIRLSNLRLSYRLDARFAKRIGLNGVMAYVYGNNLLTWTNYSGYDPEFGSGTLTPGNDTGRYPRKRELGLGININL